MENVLDKKLHKYLLQLNDFEKKSILTIAKTFIANKVQITNHYTIDQYNKELDEAVAEVEAGDFVTQEQMEKIATKW